MSPPAKWTFMVYLAGDNNLSAAGDNDLDEMRSVGSSAAVHVVAQFDNAGDQGTQRFHIQKDGLNEPVETLGETDSGDPATLIDFIEWAADQYPAERYALILWNHGGGWEPSEMDRVAQAVGARDYSPREASERSASPLGRTFFRTSLEAIYSLPSPGERAICSDDGSGHSLDTVELGRVLHQAAARLGQPIDLLGMDACLMSNLEVAYQARPYVRHIVASEENEPNQGWPYDAVLGQLLADPSQSTPDLAANIVQAYLQSYEDIGHAGPVTQSALDLARVDKLAGPLDDLADALLDRLPGQAASLEIQTAQRKSANFWHLTLWDIAHFCEELAAGTADAGVRQAANGVRLALQPGDGGFVVAEAHRGEKVARCGGVSIYLPSLYLDISRYYADLEFARERRWLPMMRAYHEL